MNPLLIKNIAYIGPWKHFVFVFVWVSLSLYLSFCKSLSRPMSSPDDKLSENIWFVWSKTSYSGDKWKCHAWTHTHTHTHTDIHVNIELEFCEMLTEFAIYQKYGQNTRNTVNIPEIWVTYQKYGQHTRNMVDIPEIWSTYQTYGQCTRNMVDIPEIWST